MPYGYFKKSFCDIEKKTSYAPGIPLQSQKDYIGYKRGINYTRTKDYVKKHTYIITKDTPLYEIMKLIDTKGLQFIPVVDQTKKVVGLITPISILKFVLRK